MHMDTDKIDLTDEEIENIKDVKLRGEKRREKWRIDNPERAAELDKRSKNRRKYSSSGIYHEELPKNYLHNEDYETRLAKAEALNGCKFRPAREYKSKRWGYPVKREQINSSDGHANNCDGQSTTLRRQVGVGFFCGITGVVAPIWSTYQMMLGEYLFAFFLLFCWPTMMYFVYKWLGHWDLFEFNRHTGLVRVPRSIFRRPFYIPYEDLDCFNGTTNRGGRGGGNMGASMIRCRKIPKRFYLFAPSYNLFYGGIDQEHWSSVLAFMDITQPVDRGLKEAIELYYQQDRNAVGDGPFPEVMKIYLDPEDKQVNRFEVW